MMPQTKVLETWVGLFVALGLVSLFFLAMKVSNLADLQVKDNSYRLTARFQNAGSLRERAPVSMGGVRIGRVTAIHFDKETYEAVVDMRIEPEYDTIPQDTTANVLTAGLLGEQYIGLSAGGASEFLKDGDEIELSQSAMVLEEVISRFLFNKAEGGAEKKPQPVASAAETPADARDGLAEIAPVKAAKAKPALSHAAAVHHHAKPKPKPKASPKEEPEHSAAKHKLELEQAKHPAKAKPQVKGNAHAQLAKDKHPAKSAQH
jgi:phospholipid/cholesterol/gamma-HCH transport system substrate-binding protein